MSSAAAIGVAGLVSACSGFVRVQATAPPPPVVSATITTDAPPPPPDAPPAPPDGQVAATADVNVEAEPQVTDADPEEVTAATEPPDPVYEEPPDSPTPGFVWVGGYWGWSGTDWGWSPGRWYAPPAGRVYVEPYYERVGGNVVFVRGYWGLHEAPRRSYGGERIVFVKPIRPATYHRGEVVHIEHRVGARPGTVTGRTYVHATGVFHPIPHATVPEHRIAARDTAVVHREGPAPREVEARKEGPPGHEAPAREVGHGEVGHEAPGHAAPAHEMPAHEAREGAAGHVPEHEGAREGAPAARMPDAHGSAQYHPAPHAAPPPAKKKK